jgi:dTMP kinase
VKSIGGSSAREAEMSFLVFEGIDGAGKSGAIEALRIELVRRGRTVRVLREPGSTPLGERVRSILLDPAVGTLTPMTEACLFNAARAELVAGVIRPALAADEDVLLDRYSYSTLAYQGAASGLDIEALRQLCHAATLGLMPDRVMLLDLPAEVALARLQRTRDRMEAKGLAFLTRAREGFLCEARRDPQRFRVINAELSQAEVIAQVLRDAI